MPETPRLSVIIPAYRADETLSHTLAALRPQVGSDTEVLVIESSGLEQATRLEREHAWVRVVGAAARLLPGRARNLGVLEARGEQLAFLDADTIPTADWLRRLRARFDRQEAVAVAGAIANGTPGDPVGTASYLLEFSEWTPGRRGTPGHGATCNLLVDRGAFESAGGFCEDVWPGEDTILTVPWGRAKRLQFAPNARVWHVNRTQPADLLRHQYRLGRSFAAVCDRVDFPHARFSHWPLLAAAPGLRLAALGLRLARQPRLLGDSARVAHWLTAGIATWTAGVAAER